MEEVAPVKIFNDIDSLKSYLKELRQKGKSIGFVPTMGYLHEGHGSLIKASYAREDHTVLSIYVNPTQFGPAEDLDAYPRDIDRDIEVAKACGADILFFPNDEVMYPEGYATYVEVENLTETLCGASRPSHFKGVTTIVTKLFNIVKPDRAYFGQKDAQQSLVIKRMAADLNMDVEVVVCPIVREDDGLAMSSRNTYLTPRQRQQATILSKSLKRAAEMLQSGVLDSTTILEEMKAMIEAQAEANLDYIQVVSERTLKPIEKVNENALIAVAVKFGKTRLIDNLTVEVSES